MGAMALYSLVVPGCAVHAQRWARACLFALGLLCASQAAHAGTAGQPGDSAAQRVLALERDGRAQPRERAAELAAWLAAGQGDTATRLDALLLQGWLLASVPDKDAAEAVARRLDDMAARGAAPLAGAAAPWVRARLAEQTGNLRAAGTLIDEAMARLPADAAPMTRLRFVAAQAHIRNGASRLEDAIRLDHQALTLADALGLPWRQAEVRNDLAYSYFQAGQPERARALNREAMDIARARRRPDDAGTCQHGAGHHPRRAGRQQRREAFAAGRAGLRPQGRCPHRRGAVPGEPGRFLPEDEATTRPRCAMPSRRCP